MAKNLKEVSYLSFIYQERGGFGEIFPEKMIFPRALARGKYHPRAEGI